MPHPQLDPAADERRPDPVSVADLRVLMAPPGDRVRVRNPGVLAAIGGLAEHPALPPEDEGAAVAAAAAVAYGQERRLWRALTRLSAAGRRVLRAELAAVARGQALRGTGMVTAGHVRDVLRDEGAGLDDEDRDSVVTAAELIGSGLASVVTAERLILTPRAVAALGVVADRELTRVRREAAESTARRARELAAARAALRRAELELEATRRGRS